MVVCPVEIDATCADFVGEELSFVLAGEVTVVVADLSGTAFCDSSGVRALVRAHQRAVAARTELRLVVPSPAVGRVLELMGVDALLPVYRTLGAALDGAPGPSGDQPGNDRGRTGHQG
jgi:anti-anti-sigma factor